MPGALAPVVVGATQIYKFFIYKRMEGLLGEHYGDAMETECVQSICTLLLFA